MARTVWLNGRLVPEGDALVSALDYGCLYGYGLFETLRAYNGRVFYLEQHLDRLARGAALLGIPASVQGLEAAVEKTLRANGLSDARVRISVSLGSGPMAPDPSACLEASLLVLAEPYTPPSETVYQRGFRATVSSIRRNSRSPLSRLKTANFMECLLARREARDAGLDEALLLNERGLLAEASVSNVFLVSGDGLVTPSVESGALPGITREVVLELAQREGVPIAERDVELEELFQATEAFLTNSLIELMPLTQVDGRPIGRGLRGPLTQRLGAAYRKLVAAS
ncbi:MAG: aminotransferase class IV [Chloroflexota bacterium]|nr:aminotransferase class IV [Chloroflexota bacterium]